MARPHSALRERAWDTAIMEQFVAPQRGVGTNDSTVFIHIPHCECLLSKPEACLGSELSVKS